MKISKASRRSRAQGFSLIEVLVALLVLAVGVLGAAALQMNALKYNHAAAVRTQATVLAYDLLDRMRANRDAVLSGQYDHDLNDGFPVADQDSTQSVRDLSDWGEQLDERLPNGDGAVTRDEALVTITVQWDESRIGGAAAQQFIFVTEL